jgi:hypothetical protein
VQGRDLIAAGFRDNTILVSDSVTYEVATRLRLPDSRGVPNLQCFTMTTDGVFALAGTRSGSLLLWEMASEVRAKGRLHFHVVL